jgi:hypothetical protein
MAITDERASDKQLDQQRDTDDGAASDNGVTRREFMMTGGLGVAAFALTSYGGRSVRGRVEPPSLPKFASRPDLHVPALTVATTSSAVAPGLITIAPYGFVGHPCGAVIADGRGELVWEHPIAQPFDITDFRVQSQNGRPVLTWWQGRVVYGHGVGSYVIADTSYTPIAHVQAGNGRQGDLHEFLLTDRGTALLTSYTIVSHDLRPVGGGADSLIQDAMFQEIDLASGKVLLEWRSLDHIALSESYSPVGGRWDYVHLNSIDVDLDQNLLVSSRNTHTLYKIKRDSGEIMWRLGGKHSDFAIAADARFAWQHDARRQPDGSISLFDNDNSASRALVLNVDEAHRRVTLRQAYTRPGKPWSNSQGNVQVLPNGNVFVGWGAQPYVSEFTPDGTLIFDARLGANYISYRAFREPWTGAAPGTPAVAAQRTATSIALYVSWNGDSSVASWTALAGTSPTNLAPAASSVRTGFETALSVPPSASHVRIQGFSADRKLLATSDLTTI